MCPSISAISDRSFRGSVNYCMPMVLNIKEHEQFFKKCVQKMLTTARQYNKESSSRFLGKKSRKLYCCLFLAEVKTARSVRSFPMRYPADSIFKYNPAVPVKYSMEDISET